MAEYINSYAEHFGIRDHISFKTKVVRIEQLPEGWKIKSVKVDDAGMHQGSYKETFVKFVAIATGHHAKPNIPHFDGQERFSGQILHSIDYKDAISNELMEKKVVVVGIGNSAVDVAVNVAELGREKPVCISTRSGAWVVPNYVHGYPTDHYACRLFFWLPCLSVDHSKRSGKPLALEFKPQNESSSNPAHREPNVDSSHPAKEH